MSALRTAWIFLTRVPAGDDPEPDLARAVAWFPAVGGMVGAITASVWLAGRELFPPPVAAAVTFAAGALLTGAFHYDGLADTADAFGGGWTRDDRLRILDDPRHGTYGVMAIACVVTTQVGALSAHGPAQGAAALVAASALGRAGAVALMHLAPAARSEGLGAAHAAVLTGRRAAGGTAAGLVLGVVALGAWAIAAAAVVAVGVAACAGLAYRKIGGITGDVLGAAEQVGETAVLLVTAILLHRHVAFPWWR